MPGGLMKRLPERPPETLPMPEKRRIGERLTRNLTIATLILLCLVSARDAHMGEKTVLQAAQGIIQSEWDENIGRLTYVSGRVSDSIQVFGSAHAPLALQSPAASPVKQAFSLSAPYIVFEGATDVFAAAPGEVMSLSHADNDACIVRIRHEGGLETLYYGLESCMVREGDNVTAATVLGRALGGEVAFEVRRDGVPVDYASRLAAR